MSADPGRIRDVWAVATEFGGTIVGIVDPELDGSFELATLRVFQDVTVDSIDGLGFVITRMDGSHAIGFFLPHVEVQRLIDDPLPMGVDDGE